MEFTSEKERMLNAILQDEYLMQIGNYSLNEIGTIYQALTSDNVVVNTVAQIIERINEDTTEKELWKEINQYLKDNI